MPSTLATFSPAPEIKLDGSVPEGFADLVFAASVEESVTGLARCEIRVDNWGATADGLGYLFVDRGTVDYGVTVEVTFGPPDERATVFAGRLTGIEGDYRADSGPTLVLLAEDALQDLRMTRRTRTFEDSSDADVVTQIAGDHGLTPDVDLDGPSHGALCQLNQSDLSFLRDRALPYGADVWLEDGTLHVGTRGDDPLVLRHGRELLSFRVLADLAMQATEQRVAGWDPDSKEEVLESADQSSIGADLGTDVGGGRLLADAFGDRVATAALPGTVTTAEAQAWAAGLYRERARRFVTGTGVADGLAGMRAGRSVTLSGLGALFDGVYRLCRVVHRYDLTAGYRTEFDVERSGIGT